MKTKNSKPVIFFRIAWMKNYQGVTKDDVPKGAGSYVKEHNFGGEVFNFQKRDNLYYGYVRVGKGGKINLSRLGAERGQMEMSGVTVVFFSRDPDFGKQYIVGCYKNATVYSDLQDKQANKRSYNSVCNSKDGVLLKPDVRTMEILGAGQSNIWYAEEYLSKTEIKNCLEFLENPKKKKRKLNGPKKSTGRSWKMDAEIKKQVEIAAMDYTAEYFESRGFTIIDVHKQNLGWDIEVKLGKKIFQIEVKGTQNSFGYIELTPNEFFHFKEKKKTYRLCVVSNALDKKKIELDMIYRKGNNWINSQGERAKVQTVKSAKISILQ